METTVPAAPSSRRRSRLASAWETGRPALRRRGGPFGDLLLSVLPGLVVFAGLFRPLLNPHRYEWLLSPNPLTFDAATSSLGWMYFARDDWHWPLGSNPDYGGAIANSLLFTDSVPAWSVFMKAVFTMVGVDGPTQVIGLGVLVCLLLQSALGYAIVRSFGATRPLALCAATLVCLMPAVLQRWNIVSLFWQWIVLAALYLVVRESRPVQRLVLWAALVVISTGITPYLTVMVLTFGCLDLLVRGWAARSWRLPAVGVPLLGAFAAAGLYIWGTFSISAGAALTGQLGEFSAVGLGFIDSAGLGWFVRDLPGGTGEGYVYIGLGVVALLLVGVTGALQRGGPVRRQYDRTRERVARQPALATLSVGATGLALLSLIPVLSVGAWSLELPMPQPAITLLSAFRANGRFMWPLMYGLVLLAVVLGGRLSSRWGTAVVAAALALQVADLSPLLSIVRDQTTQAVRTEPRFQDELAEAFRAPGVAGVEVVPAYPFPPEVPWREIGLAAFLAGHPLDTVGYHNRYDTTVVGQTIARGVTAVETRTLRQDRVYVVSDELHRRFLAGWPGARPLLRMDDWVVLRPTGRGVSGPVAPAAAEPAIAPAPGAGYSDREDDAAGGFGYWQTSPNATLAVSGPPGSTLTASFALNPTPCGPLRAVVAGRAVESEQPVPVEISVVLDAQGDGALEVQVTSPLCRPPNDPRPLYALVYTPMVTVTS